MPIHSVSMNPRLPIAGKIRLGVRKVANSGAKYPSTVEHFVCDDVPDVAQVYGEKPTELDIVFPPAELEKIIPTWLKWYGAGKQDKNGDIIGGRLKCYGTGPRGIDENGQVIPGEAYYLDKRDPVTRIVPTRQCLGDQCPDAKDRNGNKQCKQMMQVICLLPRVSTTWFFQIDTSAWDSIHSFHSVLGWHVQQFGLDSLYNSVFKLVREERVKEYVDPKDGKTKTSTQYIMLLKDNKAFLPQWLEQQKTMAISGKALSNALPPAETLIALPAEDHYEVVDAQDAVRAESTEDKLAWAKRVLSNETVAKLFAELEAVKKTTYPEKSRIMAIRKFESADIAEYCTAVVAELRRQIGVKPKEAPGQQKAPAQAAPPQGSAAPTLSQDDII